MFGHRQRPRKVELTCPSCGHRQEEPALVVSSICRECGEHFRVRKGIAYANPAMRVSGIAEILPSRTESPPPGPEHGAPTDPPADPGETWLVSAEDPSHSPHPLPAGPPPGEGEADGVPLSAGAFFGLVDAPADEGAESAPGHPAIGAEAQGREALAQGSIAALMGAQQTIVAAERDRMPPNYSPPDSRRREESLPVFPVRCFRCHHVQEVSRYAKSTQCERCSVYISLADYEIKTVKSHTLRTRGDILVSRRGGLEAGSEIACRHLTVNGAFDATIDCSGDAVFRRSGTARGRLHCDRLVIEKGCRVRFPDGVFAQRAEIAGQLEGDLTCSGRVRLFRSGVVEGKLRAVELEQREGGLVTGETILDPDTGTSPALGREINPTLIG